MATKIEFKKVYRCLPNLVTATIHVNSDGPVKIYISNVTKYTKRDLNSNFSSELIYPKFDELVDSGDELEGAGVYQLQGNVEFIAFDGDSEVEIWANGLVEDNTVVYEEPTPDPEPEPEPEPENRTIKFKIEYRDGILDPNYGELYFNDSTILLRDFNQEHVEESGKDYLTYTVNLPVDDQESCSYSLSYWDPEGREIIYGNQYGEIDYAPGETVINMYLGICDSVISVNFSQTVEDNDTQFLWWLDNVDMPEMSMSYLYDGIILHVPSNSLINWSIYNDDETVSFNPDHGTVNTMDTHQLSIDVNEAEVETADVTINLGGSHPDGFNTFIVRKPNSYNPLVVLRYEDFVNNSATIQLPLGMNYMFSFNYAPTCSGSFEDGIMTVVDGLVINNDIEAPDILTSTVVLTGDHPEGLDTLTVTSTKNGVSRVTTELNGSDFINNRAEITFDNFAGLTLTMTYLPEYTGTAQSTMGIPSAYMEEYNVLCTTPTHTAIFTLSGEHPELLETLTLNKAGSIEEFTYSNFVNNTLTVNVDSFYAYDWEITVADGGDSNTTSGSFSSNQDNTINVVINSAPARDYDGINDLTVNGHPYELDASTGIIKFHKTSNEGYGYVSDYAFVNRPIDFDGIWELNFKFTTSTDPWYDSCIIGTNNDRSGFRIFTENNQLAFLVGNGTWFNGNGNDYLTDLWLNSNTTYWIKCGWNAECEYYMQYSTDGVNYYDCYREWGPDYIGNFTPLFGRSTSFDYGGSDNAIYLYDTTLIVGGVSMWDLRPVNSVVNGGASEADPDTTDPVPVIDDPEVDW